MHAYQPERLKPSSTPKHALLRFVAEHRGLTGGAALSLLVMSSVFVNAAWYQPGKHPSPLFSTRVDATATSRIAKVKKPDVAVVKTAEASKKTKTGVSSSSKELLREVQTALSVRGYYGGKLDGVFGSRTKKAITSFQSDHSLKPDGTATVRLLTQVLMSASARPQEVPIPKQNIVAKVQAEVQTVKVSTATAPAQADGLIARIQSGLRAYGHDVKVDGKMGQQTATAIQRFQLDYGMKVTGEPSDLVLKKLRAIGAYKNG
ncbi:MAG: peptidoglycan-binding protein [Rhizobiaceae bacterium]